MYRGDGGGPTFRARTRSRERHDAPLGPTRETSLPNIGDVRFLVHTFDGLRGGAAAECELREGTHPLTPLFLAAHRLIAAIRERTEERGAR